MSDREPFPCSYKELAKQYEGVEYKSCRPPWVTFDKAVSDINISRDVEQGVHIILGDTRPEFERRIRYEVLYDMASRQLNGAWLTSDIDSDDGRYLHWLLKTLDHCRAAFLESEAKLKAERRRDAAEFHRRLTKATTESPA